MDESPRKGALDLSGVVDDISVGPIEAPYLDCSPASKAKDLFAVKKRAAWNDVQVAEARCDFAPDKMRLTNRGGAFFISLWKKSVYGRTLTEIKGDDAMVGFFADSIAPLISSVLGSFLSPEDYAIVTTPKRRHKERNFATMISEKIAEHLGLPFYDDCAFARSKQRTGAVFDPGNIPPQRNIIVFDDFVTTGQTLVSMQNLLLSKEKNAIFFAGINNKL